MESNFNFNTIIDSHREAAFSTIIDRHREAAVEINSALNNIFNPEASEEQNASELDSLLNDLFNQPEILKGE